MTPLIFNQEKKRKGYNKEAEDDDDNNKESAIKVARSPFVTVVLHADVVETIVEMQLT